MELTIDQALQQAVAAHKVGKLEDAERLYRAILQAQANHPDANHNLGVLTVAVGKPFEAVSLFKLALEANPKVEQFWLSYADALIKLERFDEAKRVLVEGDKSGVSPEKLEILHQQIQTSPSEDKKNTKKGLALSEKRKRLAEKKKSKKRKVQGLSSGAAPSPDQINHLLEHYQADRLVEFEALATSLTQQFPKHPVGWKALGIALKQTGRLAESLVPMQSAVALSPQDADAHSNLGNTLKALGRLDESEASYRQATALKPDFAEAHNNLGAILRELGRLEEAEASYRQAVALKPDFAEAHNNLGNTFKELGRLDEAILSYQRSLDLGLSDADAPEAQAQLIHQRCHICDFSVFDGLSATAQRLGISTARVPPFNALSWADDPEQHLLRAQVYVRETFKWPAQTLRVRRGERPERLKIGYFSADFHDFAGMYLMAGLLESHDRDRFEVYAFSYGPDKDDAMRRRIVAAVDHFIDIREMSTQEAVDLSREHGIDIALHRNGHTQGSRTELFQHRLAPVQISYLGYPETLGADFIDYLVADPVVIPEEERQYYNEKIIYLPDTYQPNDNTRQIAETNTTRADFGLPEEGFVLCCFNQNYKISPQEFDIWMRVLGQVEGTVLWLLKSNRWAEENLKKEAEHRGIDPSRVIFAEKIPNAEHLARHKHADLFVDTFNYNAHTTASDALWSGLPIVTKQGRQFAARVAASLLRAVGLPELITESEEEYERLILELAHDRQRLGAIKETLKVNRHTEPLFDTQRYTHQLEEGLGQAYQQYFEGGNATDVIVAGTV